MSETNSSDYTPPPPPSSPIQLSKQKCINTSPSFIIDNSKCVDTTTPPPQLTRQLSIQTTSNDNLNFKCDCYNNKKKHINNRLIRSGFDIKK